MKTRHFFTNRRIAAFLTVGSLFIVAGAAIFMQLEGWSCFDYF